MYCIHCGAEISDGSKFCTACGKPVKGAEAAAAAQQTAENVTRNPFEDTVGKGSYDSGKNEYNKETGQYTQQSSYSQNTYQNTYGQSGNNQQNTYNRSQNTYGQGGGYSQNYNNNTYNRSYTNQGGYQYSGAYTQSKNKAYSPLRVIAIIAAAIAAACLVYYGAKTMIDIFSGLSSYGYYYSSSDLIALIIFEVGQAALMLIGALLLFINTARNKSLRSGSMAAPLTLVVIGSIIAVIEAVYSGFDIMRYMGAINWILLVTAIMMLILGWVIAGMRRGGFGVVIVFFAIAVFRTVYYIYYLSQVTGYGYPLITVLMALGSMTFFATYALVSMERDARNGEE